MSVISKIADERDALAAQVRKLKAENRKLRKDLAEALERELETVEDGERVSLADQAKVLLEKARHLSGAELEALQEAVSGVCDGIERIREIAQNHMEVRL